MINSKEIGRRLKALRGNLAIETLASLLGVSRSSVSMYENGERIPRDEVKVKYANIFGKTVQSIFFDEKCHF